MNLHTKSCIYLFYFSLHFGPWE